MRSRRGRDEREERALSLLASDCLRRRKNDEKRLREEAVGLPFFSFASFTFFPLQPRRETLSNLLPHSLARARAESLRAMPQQPKGATTDPRRRWLASRVRECWPLCVLGLCRSFPPPLFSLNPPPSQKKTLPALRCFLPAPGRGHCRYRLLLVRGRRVLRRQEQQQQRNGRKPGQRVSRVVLPAASDDDDDEDRGNDDDGGGGSSSNGRALPLRPLGKSFYFSVCS